MTEVIERVLKTFELVSTADCFRMPAVCFGSTSFLQTELYEVVSISQKRGVIAIDM